MQQKPAIGMRIGAHAPLAFGRQLRQFRQQSAGRVKERLRPIALHPAFQLRDMIRMRRIHQQRHLMRTKCAFDLQAINHFRPGPALRRSEHDHRPARPDKAAVLPCVVLDIPDFQNDLLQCRCHGLMHRVRIIALNKMRGPAAAFIELFQLVMLDAGQQRRIADLVAIQMQDRQHRTIRDRAEKFVRLPGGRQRAGFGFAVADHAGDDQIRIVEGSTEGMAQRIPKFTALVDRSRRRGCDMAGDAAGKGELFEQLFQTRFILGDVRIDLAPGAFEIDIADQCRAAMPRAGDVEHVQVMRFDDSI